MATRPATGGRFLALDGLRGVAALGVLLVHAFPAPFFWMWSFVDLFFVISGFVITGILLEADLRHPRFLLHFWMRRILRIWPVYFLALAATVALLVLRHFKNPDAADTHWWPYLFFIQFYEGYLGGTLAEFHRYAGTFVHSWSVAIEEQFYVLWPLILLLLSRRASWVVLTCLALMGMGIYFRSEQYYVILLITRPEGLAVGALAALAYRQIQQGVWSARAVDALSFIALAGGLALAGSYLRDGYTVRQFNNFNDVASFGDWNTLITGFALLYGFLVWHLACGRLRVLTAFLTSAPLLYLGSISYAIYMYQGAVRYGTIHLLHGRFDERIPHWVEIVSILGIVAAAALSKRWIETPVLALKDRFPITLRKGV